MIRNRKIQKAWFVGLVCFWVLLGCKFTAGGGTDAAAETALAESIYRYSTSAGGRFPSPTITPLGWRTNSPTPTQTAPPSETPASTGTFTSTFTATIAHSATPPGAAGMTRYILDSDSQDYAPQQRVPAGSDVYQSNLFERPYTAEAMEYLSDVDLTRVELKIASPWVYLTFQFAEPRTGGVGQTMYGAEFDTNLDGRGDYLVWGASPPEGSWTSAGVEIWKDTNADVGGPYPQLTNAPWTSGNGYDQNLFSGGQGADPDLAWIRQIDGGTKVQLAFKNIAIKNPIRFLWNGWADLGVQRPDWFDYNDRFTQAEAGSPLPIQADYYPLKALSGIDNTCRDAYGFTPTGTEAGLC